MRYSRLVVTSGCLVMATGTTTSATAQCPDTVAPSWIQTEGGPGSDWARDLAVHNDDTVVVTAESPDASTGKYDILTIKYAPDGTELWAVQNASPLVSSSPLAVAVDGQGEVYVTGWLEVSLPDCQCGAMFTVKYDAGGQVLWEQTYVGPGNRGATGGDLVVDDDGNVYVAGVWLHRPNGPNALTESHFHVVKYDANGNLVWTHTEGNNSQRGVAESIRLGPGGDVYVLGYLLDQSNSAWQRVVRLDPTGSSIFSTALPDQVISTTGRFFLDAAGNAYVTGQNWDGEAWGLYTAKLDAAGNVAWTRAYQDNGVDWVGRGVVADAMGNVYAVGEAQYAPGGLIVSYDADGNERWAQILDDPDCASRFKGLRLDTDGKLHAAAGYLFFAGSAPAVLTFSTDGELLERRELDVAQLTGYVFELASDDSVYVAGPIWTEGATWDLATVRLAASAPCVADLDASGGVGIADLLLLLGAWGTPAGDVDGDGTTGILDFLALLGTWGPCPLESP